jgi:hypothetical protein
MHQFWIWILNPIPCSRHAMKNHFWPLISRHVLLSTVHHHVLCKIQRLFFVGFAWLFSRSSRALEAAQLFQIALHVRAYHILFNCRPRPRSSTGYAQFALPAHSTPPAAFTLLSFRPLHLESHIRLQLCFHCCCKITGLGTAEVLLASLHLLSAALHISGGAVVYIRTRSVRIHPSRRGVEPTPQEETTCESLSPLLISFMMGIILQNSSTSDCCTYGASW